MKDAFHIHMRSDAVLRNLSLSAGLGLVSMMIGTAWAAPTVSSYSQPATANAPASTASVQAAAPVAAANIAPIVDAVEAQANTSFQPRKGTHAKARAKAFVDHAKEAATISSPTELVADAGQASFQQGQASWYGGQFHNRRTANGERFDMNAMTAAHKTLPFGTMVLVKSPKTGKSVVVRINDRGPYAKGRVIDLSKGAATKLGVHGAGVYSVVLYKMPRNGNRPQKIAGGS